MSQSAFPTQWAILLALQVQDLSHQAKFTAVLSPLEAVRTVPGYIITLPYLNFQEWQIGHMPNYLGLQTG